MITLRKRKDVPQKNVGNETMFFWLYNRCDTFPKSGWPSGRLSCKIVDGGINEDIQGGFIVGNCLVYSCVG